DWSPRRTPGSPKPSFTTEVRSNVKPLTVSGVPNKPLPKSLALEKFRVFIFLALFLFQNGTRAESTVSLEKKVSKDILKKVSEGRGGEFVRVIIQPANAADISIDSTLVVSGGENIRKFKNFAVRVVTLPVSAAINL